MFRSLLVGKLLEAKDEKLCRTTRDAPSTRQMIIYRRNENNLSNHTAKRKWRVVYLMIMRVSDFCPASLRERRNAPQVLTSSRQTTTTKAIDLLATTTTTRVTDRPITITTTTDRQQVATTATRATDLHRQATSPNQAARIRAVATTARQATTRAATQPPATTTKVVNIETQSRLSPTQAGGELFLSPCLEICSYKRPILLSYHQQPSWTLYIITALFRSFSQTSAHKATPATFTAGIRPSRSLALTSHKVILILIWMVAMLRILVFNQSQQNDYPIKCARCLFRRRTTLWQLSKVDTWRPQHQPLRMENSATI